MLNPGLKKRLESLRELPTIPFVITEVLNALENRTLSASQLAGLIERDQTLTLRVLRVANSPFFGMARKISTVDLAIVVLGIESIKEIVLGLIIQRFYSNITNDIIDIKSFWHYSVFCGACSRYLARKIGYRLAGEAFVAGLMHDIGILILAEYFGKEFGAIRRKLSDEEISITDAESIIVSSDHCEIGSWIAEKWNLPGQLVLAIRYHHTKYIEARKMLEDDILWAAEGAKKVSGIEMPLTAIVAMAEWFAGEMGFKAWSAEKVEPEFYLAKAILEDMKKHDVLDSESVINVMKQEIEDEYRNASIFAEMPNKPLF